MTAQAEALELAETGTQTAHTIAGALLLACDLLDEQAHGLSAPELEFVGHCRELTEGVCA